LRRFAGWIARIYRHDLPTLLRRDRMAIAIVILFLVVAAIIGWAYVTRFPLPEGTISLEGLSEQDFETMADISFLPSLTTGGIFGHNARVLLLAAVLAVISLGVLPILMLMIPIILVAFIGGQFALLGMDPWAFLGAFIVPHGLFEMPAAIIATAFALRMGMSITFAREGKTVSENVIAALADFLKVFLFLVVPLLVIAAFVEANVTPRIVLWAFGG
jgi:stage II sporulation protein M